MDITFKTPEGRFNYRVCAVMIHDGKLLAMRDERSPCFYLPGGRVKLHETAEDAVLRESLESAPRSYVRFGRAKVFCGECRPGTVS